jgi:multiple sugar transport system ATP-binding protein
MAQIVLDKVSKRFADGTDALHPTDLTIGDGEFFILVGPSGCGKSTLLNIIVGLTQPTSGDVRVGGETVTALDPKDRNMAMVFQSYAIYPHMTVRENIAFPLRLAKLGDAEIERRVGQAAELLELGELLGRRPADLSGGQRQRVAMGRAIVRRPAAFLLDEPLSNLDARLRLQTRGELARLHRRLGATMVYVTHDQTEAMTLGQRVAVLRRGRVQQVGTPRELYRTPANLFVAGFLGAPPMNFLPAALEHRRLRLPMVELDLPAAYEHALGGQRRELIVGIRPEQLVDPGLGGADAWPRIDAPVDRVEWLGADQYAYADWPLDPTLRIGAAGDDLAALRRDRVGLVARIASTHGVRAGGRLALAFDPNAISLFDAHGGERIVPRPD